MQSNCVLALVKTRSDATTPTQNGPEIPDPVVSNVVLKHRDDAKRSESPAVVKGAPRSDSIRY